MTVAWQTCARCGTRWEGKMPTNGMCDDCKFVDPRFGKRVAP